MIGIYIYDYMSLQRLKDGANDIFLNIHSELNYSDVEMSSFGIIYSKT